MDPIPSHPIIEDVFDIWSTALGDAREAYRGHTYRVFNYARHLIGSAERDEALAVASAFHDIGIWTDGTWDYIPPSRARAEEYLREQLPGAPASLVADAIEQHHRLTRVRGTGDAAVVEAFRRADLADFSFGIVRGGVDAALVKQMTAAFPYASFQEKVIRFALPHIARHPWKPLPMVRL